MVTGGALKNRSAKDQEAAATAATTAEPGHRLLAVKEVVEAGGKDPLKLPPWAPGPGVVGGPEP